LIPLEGIEVRVGPGDRIEVRGPTVSPGYVGEPERSPADWFTTSDRGRIEPDGSLLMLGRSDRMIVSGGENVDPAQVEAAIESHPAVIEVAVIPLPDEEWGEAIAAAYVGDVTAEELRRLIVGRLSSAAIPKRWLQLEVLPRTELGKIDTTRLVAMFDS
jgi:O-succinylbenzoic acid--CoA ligase